MELTEIELRDSKLKEILPNCLIEKPEGFYSYFVYFRGSINTRLLKEISQLHTDTCSISINICYKEGFDLCLCIAP